LLKRLLKWLKTVKLLILEGKPENPRHLALCVKTYTKYMNGGARNLGENKWVFSAPKGKYLGWKEEWEEP
jgi:hypothetical protein